MRKRLYAKRDAEKTEAIKSEDVVEAGELLAKLAHRFGCLETKGALGLIALHFARVRRSAERRYSSNPTVAL